jgi:hypothetical protein
MRIARRTRALTRAPFALRAPAQHMGEAGYAAAAERILSAADALAAGIAEIPGLAVMGTHTMVVAFRSTEGAALDIYAVNDALTAAGWHLNALQRPPALHFCVTDACAGAVPALLAALRDAVGAARERARSRGAHPPGAMAPVYGLAGGLPDRGAVVRARQMRARRVRARSASIADSSRARASIVPHLCRCRARRVTC